MQVGCETAQDGNLVRRCAHERRHQLLAVLVRGHPADRVSAAAALRARTVDHAGAQSARPRRYEMRRDRHELYALLTPDIELLVDDLACAARERTQRVAAEVERGRAGRRLAVDGLAQCEIGAHAAKGRDLILGSQRGERVLLIEDGSCALVERVDLARRERFAKGGHGRIPDCRLKLGQNRPTAANRLGLSRAADSPSISICTAQRYSEN